MNSEERKTMPSPTDDAHSFKEVLKEERHEIQQRRTVAFNCQVEPPRNLAGLALSGGGIRSATFCLGVLQGLNNLGLLKMFDYLSTVSGGGFAGGWWSAWQAREGAQTTFPPPERIEPERSKNYSQGSRSGRIVEGSISAGADPIHHLRLFANYLTPRRGALSMDTWRAIGFIVRNLVLTWFVLLPILLATVLLGQVYFAVFTNNFPHERKTDVQEITADGPMGHSLNENLAHLPASLEERKETLKDRAVKAAIPVAILGAFTVFFAFCWMIGIQSGSKLLKLVNAGVGGLLTIYLASAFLPHLLVLLLAAASVLGFLGVLLIVFRVRLNTVRMVRRMGGWIEQTWLEGGPGHILRSARSWLREQVSDAKPIKREQQWQKQVYLNSMTRWMSRSMIFMVITAAVLAVAGFGHEAVEYVCCYSAPGGSSLLKSGLHYAAKSLSITGVFAALGGLIYTWGRAAPTGGGDKADAKDPSPTSQLIFAITPPLVMAVLAVAMAWLAHVLVAMVLANPDVSIDYLTLATRLGIFFAFILVLIELDLSGISPRAVNVSLIALTTVNAATLGWLFFQDKLYFMSIPVWSFVILFITATIVVGKFLAEILFGIGTKELGWVPFVVVSVFVYFSAAVAYQFVPEGHDNIDTKWLARISAVVIALAIFKLILGRMTVSGFFTKETGGYRRRFYVAVVVLPLALTLAIFGIILLAQFASESRFVLTDDPDVLDSAFRGIVRAGVVFLVLGFFQIWRIRGNYRSTWLATSLLLTLSVLVLLFIQKDMTQEDSGLVVKAVILLAATALTWVMTIGWIVDPNSLSIHAFYKSRLVRAYLGASNPIRKQQKREVTEAVEGDDVLLSDLRNCAQGGPYHLINTTLNLVGGRDLSTAQRSSAMFVLSKNYCGSFRTRYRKTSQYMGGELSLGTALAVSGAAVAPNMGSMKTTASLAMLMTLLNVRLGYWAPTPNKDAWYSPQARLWPYYVLREFLSETTDLSSYCYLTDGGHFDNSGLYSLVERGCRYIVVVDGSADPSPCFSDLGNAVRRCRIDFKAEIDIDITPLLKISKEDKFPRANHVVGSIKYSQPHFHDLGWDNVPEDERTGVIVYIKPGLIERQPSLSIDVRQYAIENASFPHQTTTDQWFDEAQFESYRSLGEQSTQFIIEGLNVAQTQLYKSALRKQKAHQKLNEEETNSLAALALSQKISQKSITLEDVPKLFRSLKGLKSA